MDRPIYGFYISLFNVFIVYIVFANFLGWSGGSINVTGYDGVDWSNSYIGFESLRIMVADYQHTIGAFSISEFIVALEQLTSTLTFGIPRFIASLNSGFNLLELGKLLVTMFFQPLLFLGYSLYCILFVLVWVGSIVVTFFKLCGGAYNITFDDTSDIWEQWSYLSSEYEWRNLIPHAI